MNRFFSILFCMLCISCSVSHYPTNNHKKTAYQHRHVNYGIITRVNKPVYKGRKAADRRIDHKEGQEWKYRRAISRRNTIKNPYIRTGGYAD